MSAQVQCDKILNQVHDSKLHFLVQETPFSLYLTVRKRFNLNSPKLEHLNSVSDQSSDFLENVLKLKETRDIIESLEVKLQKAEKGNHKISSDSQLKHEEFKGEIKMLKDSIKKSDEEVKDRDRALKEVNKLVKTKEKEIHNLQLRLDNSLETVQALKQSNFDLKKEIKESNKASKSAEKKTSLELKKSESKIRNLEEKLEEKQKIISDLKSTSSSYKVSPVITNEITQKPSMNNSTTPKKSSNLTENNNYFPNICNPTGDPTIMGNKLRLPVTVPKQRENSSLFNRLAPLKTSPTTSTFNSAAAFSSNISEASLPIPVSNPFKLLESEDNSPDTIEVKDDDSTIETSRQLEHEDTSEDLFEHLNPQERHIVEQISKIIRKTIN